MSIVNQSSTSQNPKPWSCGTNYIFNMGRHVEVAARDVNAAFFCGN
jgi:hypothetical protein